MAGIAVDSEAWFLERCQKVKLSESTIRTLVDAGFKSFGTLAFAVSTTPTQLDEADVKRWMGSIFPHDFPPDQSSKVRRLMFEAQNLSVADMRARVEPAADTAVVRAMPNAERLARQEALKKRVTGLILSPETLPAHSVVDTLVKQLEDGVLQYLPAYRIISRAQEAQQLKKDQQVVVDGEGNLKMASKAESATCDTHTDLALRNAWTRRSLAYDLAGLCSFQVLEEWCHKCFLALMRPVPSGYSKVTTHQLMRGFEGFEGGLQARMSLQTQCSHDGFQPDSYAVKHACTATNTVPPTPS